jgi:flagellar basal-body rod protein FlgC
MYGALDISVSGMIAQRTRLNVIQANIANANSLEDSEGNFAPYLRRAAMFKAGDPAAKTESGRERGVHVAEIEINPDSLVPRYDPGNPYANSEGIVMVPDINPVVEQINAMEASRAYEANVVAAETTKAMMNAALRLLG